MINLISRHKGISESLARELLCRSPQNLPQIDDFFPGFGPASPPWPPLLLRHIKEGRPASPKSPSPSPSPSPSYTLPRPLSPPQRAPKREHSPESEDGECSEDATPPPSYKRLCQWELEKIRVLRLLTWCGVAKCHYRYTLSNLNGFIQKRALVSMAEMVDKLRQEEKYM